jgi:eukaryotic-like serine/threonine-protein kinase
MIGTIVDQYKIIKRIAGGGMGEVYRAIDLELERDVAIKCVRPELSDLEEATKRFRAEARTLAKLAHLNIATVYRFFAEDDRLFLVMEYIDGKPFGEIIAGSGSIPHQQAVILVQDALKCLGYAHKNNIVHRDIKPGNLMVDQENTVKVLDFGIAHLVGGTRLTRVGSVVGTPAYMAPEQILGKTIDPRTDLYSIGIVLYEMLSGKLPYAANSDFELMRAHLEEVPRPMSELSKNDVPMALQQTVERALAKDSTDRFQSAEEFSQALEDAEQNRTFVRPAPVSPDVTDAENSRDGGTTVLITDNANPAWKKYQPFAIGGTAALVLTLLAFLFWPSTRVINPDEVSSASNTTTNANPGNLPAIPGDPDNLNNTVVEETQNLARDISPPSAAGLATSDFSASNPANGGNTSVSGNLADAASNNTQSPPPASAGTSTNSASTAAQPSVVTTPTSPVAAKPSRSTSAATNKLPKVAVVKVSVHEKQGTGRFSRDAGYNGAFRLSVPLGANRNVEISEVAKVFRDGQLVRDQVVTTEVRTPGTFKSKQRIQGLKTLEPGEYQIQLQFVHEGKTLGQHNWKLMVSG